jgi:hypothetical protein
MWHFQCNELYDVAESGGSSGKKREMNVTLTKAMLLMKLLTHSLTHPALAGMTNRIF